MNRRIILIALMLVLAAPVFAEASESVDRHYEYDITQVDELRLEFAVGSLRIEPTNDEKLSVHLTIKERSSAAWLPFWNRKPDLTEMELDSDIRGSKLWLRFDEQRVTTDFVIRVPPLAALRIDAGVGSIDGRFPDSAVDINLGVGSVDLTAEDAAVGLIDLSAGVGDTHIRGGERMDSRQALVGSSSSAQGSGNNALRIKLGVGDITLTIL